VCLRHTRGRRSKPATEVASYRQLSLRDHHYGTIMLSLFCDEAGFITTRDHGA
jgi:hypothetical protein